MLFLIKAGLRCGKPLFLPSYCFSQDHSLVWLGFYIFHTIYILKKCLAAKLLKNPLMYVCLDQLGHWAIQEADFNNILWHLGTCRFKPKAHTGFLYKISIFHQILMHSSDIIFIQDKYLDIFFSKVTK